MKLAENIVEIEQSEDLTTSGFAIQFDAKMANLLSNKIYSDPILAVVREYIANACDSHINQPIKRAVDVGLPSLINPTWFVRDYGPGLSQDDIMGNEQNKFCGLFNTYGKSNKSDSNLSIGGFGLGSKAGFAYIKQDGAFTVTSWHAGHKKVYTCHRNAKGIPSVTLMSDTVSNEPTGIKIAVPVSSNDFQAFVKATASVILYMEQEFNITGAQINQKAPEYELRKDNWGIRKVNYNIGHTNSSIVVMGGIAYPIDATHFHGDNRDLLSYYLTIWVPIGSVELSVSREALSYEKSTINYITDELNKIRAELAKEMAVTLDSCTSLIEVSRKYWEYKDSHTLGRYIPTGYKWQGKELLYQVEYRDYYDNVKIHHKKTMYLPEQSPKTTPKMAMFQSINIEVHDNYDSYSLQVRENRWGKAVEISLTKDYLFVYDDGVGMWKRRTSRLLKDLKEAHEKSPQSSLHVIFIKDCDYNTFLDLVKKSGEHNRHCKLSEIEEYVIPRVKTPYIPKTDKKRYISFLTEGASGSYTNRSYFGSCEVDFADQSKNYYYIPTQGYDLYNDFGGKKWVSPSLVNDYVEELIPGFDAKVDKVYLVSVKYKELAKNNPKWINVHDYLLDKYTKLLVDTTFRERFAFKVEVDSHGWRTTAVASFIKKLYTTCPQLQGSKLDDMYKRAVSQLVWDDATFNTKETQFNMLHNLFPNEVDTFKYQGNTIKLVSQEELWQKVPILRWVNLQDGLSKEALDNIATIVLHS